MRTLWRKLLGRLRLLAVTERGVAAVEFALVLPIMLIVYMGSVEASVAISMDRRVQSITGALGDLVARSDKTIAASSLRDYFRAAGALMTPYPAADVRQVVTQVEVRANGTAVVSWSRQFANDTVTVGTAHPAGSPFTLPAAMTNVARGNFVIVSEASYDHQPLYGFWIFRQTINLYRENFFMPRFGGSITIN